MKSRRSGEGMNLDFLMDTVTNVVGILILILVLNSLNITNTVQRIRQSDPSQFGISPEQLDQMTQQATQQRATLRELATKAFGIDTQLLQDRQTVQQQQQVLAALRQDVSQVKPTTNPVQELQKVVDERKKRQQQLQTQLTKLEAELQAMKGQLEETPKPSAPPPKIVTLPNPRDAPEGARPVMFLCQSERLMFFDPEELRERAKKRVQYLLRPLQAKAGPGGEIDCQRLVDTYNKDAIADTEFRTRLVVENFTLVLIYEYKGAGETSERFRSPGSRFQAALRRMDPKKSYARFLVWPDSFETYVQARRVCDERGVLAGWEPYTESYQWKISLGIPVACQGKPKPPPPKPAPPDTAPKPAPGPPPPPLPNDVVD